MSVQRKHPSASRILNPIATGASTHEKAHPTMLCICIHLHGVLLSNPEDISRKHSKLLMTVIKNLSNCNSVMVATVDLCNTPMVITVCLIIAHVLFISTMLGNKPLEDQPVILAC